MAALYQRWGLPTVSAVPDLTPYRLLHEEGPLGLRWDDWPNADYVLLPFDWAYARSRQGATVVEMLTTRAQRDRKHLLVFYWSDDETPIPLKEATVFRTSLRRDERYWRSVFTMPGWLRDPLGLVEGASAGPRAKRLTPLVGFCGHTVLRRDAMSLPSRARRLLRSSLVRLRVLEPRPPTPLFLRRLALDTIRSDRRLATNFIEREAFFGGAANLHDGTWDKARLEIVRRDYALNIVNCDYTLCIRGAGNFSHRYFDTLAAGRIPVLIDTAGGLPYDFLVDWRSSGLILSVGDLPRLPDALLSFHNALHPDDFVQLQLDNRKRFLSFLTPDGFFRHFPAHFNRGHWRGAEASDAKAHA